MNVGRIVRRVIAPLAAIAVAYVGLGMAADAVPERENVAVSGIASEGIWE